MKITILALQKFGAAPLCALEFSDALCRHGVAHDVVVSSANERLAAFSDNAFRHTYPVPTFGSSGCSFLLWTFSLMRPLRLMALLVRRRPRFVFSMDFHPWLPCLILLRPLLRFQWFHATHDNPFASKEAGRPFGNWLEQFCLHFADSAFCYSEFMQCELERARPGLGAIPLALGAYETAVCGVKPDPIYAKRRPLVACLGRIEPYKGMETFVEVVSRLRAQGIQAYFLIAGRGRMDAETLSRAQSLEVDVQQRWFSPDAFTALALVADIIVLPYAQGSQSGVIALALAAGKPVVATRVGGITEQIVDGVTGMLVEPQNPDALAEAVGHLLAHPEERARMGANALAVAQSRSAWNASADTFLHACHL